MNATRRDFVPAFAVLALLAAAFPSSCATRRPAEAAPRAESAERGGGDASALPDPEPASLLSNAVAKAPAVTVEAYPDADEVSLFEWEETRYGTNGTYTTEWTSLAKILTQRGLEGNRTFSFSNNDFYGSTTVLVARVHSPDGTARDVDLGANLSEAVDTGSLASNIHDPNDKTFTLAFPELAVGDAVEVSMRRVAKRARCEGVYADYLTFESDHPILFQGVRITGPASMPLRSRAFRDAGPVSLEHAASTNEEAGTITEVWTAGETPRFFAEPHMPPAYDCTARLLLSTAPDWESLSRWYARLCAPHLAATNAAMALKVAELVASATNSATGGQGENAEPDSADPIVAALHDAMTWDAITNALAEAGDKFDIEDLEDGWPMGEAFYKVLNGAAPFVPNELGFEPRWPDDFGFEDLVLPGVARNPDLADLSVVDPAFAKEFDRFRRELVGAVDAGSVERFSALVDPAWRNSLAGGGDWPVPFGGRFFAAAMCDRESEYDVPRIRFRPLLRDEEILIADLAPGESNRLDRIYACVAWMWDNGPKMEFFVVRDGDAFSMVVPPLWRFRPAYVERVGRDPGVLGSGPSFEPPWRSDASDRFGAVLLEALRTGDAAPLLDRICTETPAPESVAGLRYMVALNAATLDGRTFRVRSRLPVQDTETGTICEWLDPSEPGKYAFVTGASPARLHPGLWLAFDAVVETNGIECPLAVYYAVRGGDGGFRLLPPAFPTAFPTPEEKPSPEVIREARGNADRILRLAASDARCRFLGLLANSLASTAGAKPAFVPGFRFVLQAEPDGEAGEVLRAEDAETAVAVQNPDASTRADRLPRVQREAAIRALFDFVSREVRYMGAMAESEAPGYEPHDVSLTFDNRYGVCRDKAALLVAMLRMAGIDAWPVLINVGPRKDPQVPQPYFNHAIVAADSGDPDDPYLLMDPTSETTRSLLPEYLCEMSYLVARDEGETIRETPPLPVEQNLLRAETVYTLHADASADVTTTLSFAGVNDAAYRGYFASIPRDGLRAFFERVLQGIPGAVLTGWEVRPAPEALRTSPEPLSVRLDYAIAEAARGAEDGRAALLDLPTVPAALAIASRVVGDLGLEKRRFPLVTDYPCGWEETVEIRLPDGVALSPAPAAERQSE